MALGAILQAAGAIGGAAGSVFDTIGSIQQAKETKKQMEQGKVLAANRRNMFSETYSDLESMAAGQATYRGDISAYTKAEEEAKRQQQMATQTNPADQLFRDQARQSTSNYIEQASRGARSGVDLMAIAGMGAGMENQQMLGINAATANQRMSSQDRANANLINSLSRTAAATARERGMEFSSIVDKQRNQLGIAREKGLGAIDMNYNDQQEDFARRGAWADAKKSMWSGMGDTFRAIGGGIAESNMQNSYMEYLKGMNSTADATKAPTEDVIAWNYSSPIGGKVLT